MRSDPFCTVFGFSLFGRVGVYSGISQWYHRVGDAGALRAEPLPLSHPWLSCAVKNKSHATGHGTGAHWHCENKNTEVSRPFCGCLVTSRTYVSAVSPPLERILKNERRTFRQVGGGRSTTCRARFKTRNAFCSIRRDLNTGARRAPAAIWSSAVFNGPPRPAPPTLLVPPRVPRQSGMSLR